MKLCSRKKMTFTYAQHAHNTQLKRYIMYDKQQGLYTKLISINDSRDIKRLSFL